MVLKGWHLQDHSPALAIAMKSPQRREGCAVGRGLVMESAARVRVHCAKEGQRPKQSKVNSFTDAIRQSTLRLILFSNFLYSAIENKLFTR
jgi:hypothetical protein